ncbi:MAG: glycosyl hydrolase [Bacteroidia bacterium]
MKDFVFKFCILLGLLSANILQAQLLKSVVYDFDGLDENQTDLPEGDYNLNDLSYSAVGSPLPYNDMVGDKVLKLNLNWNAGNGSFGKGISRFIEFDANRDVFNFYFYNPFYNNQDAVVDVIITDDDNQDNVYEFTSDDNWQKSLTIPASAGWQLISIPLKDFRDTNPYGDGIFNIAFTANQGMLLMAEFYFRRQNEAGSAVFYIDMINFSEENLPTGNTVLDLPAKNMNDHCLLGAFQQEPRGQEYLIPPQFESLFPTGQGKKIRYANYFLDWAIDGTTIAKELPGNEVQQLLSNGYTPVITWEPLFQGYARLDPVQPRLSNIINGDYNSYIDAFAQKIKTYNDTIIIRLMHEFEGDWYPWSLSQNNHDPDQYKTAFQMVVNRFRNIGATKVKWMWCVNSDYAPYAYYNWVVHAYPGDAFVDIVASDIYNNHFPVNNPYWKSFKQQATESYYYLTKYFPQKPFFICEVGCRERFNWENPASQSKGDWYMRMDKEMQSDFHKARALIFFNAYPDQNWFVNSSPYALQSLTDNVWNDNYYFSILTGIVMEQHAYGDGLYVYPNPSTGLVTINYSSDKMKNLFSLRIHNSYGETVYSEEIHETMNSFSKEIDGRTFQKGIYLVELTAQLVDIPEKKIIYEARKLVLE